MIAGTRRYLLVQEMRTRLETLGFPVYYAETSHKQDQAIYFFDGKETLDKERGKRRAIYVRRLPLTVYVEFQCVDKQDIPERATDWFDRLQAAVETDEDFGGLCIEYEMDYQDMGVLSDNWVGLQVGWSFVYPSKFLGYGVQSQVQ